jgi:hypothetical protein
VPLAGAFPLVAVGDACGLWDGRKDKVHFFELRGMALTGPVAVYLAGRFRRAAIQSDRATLLQCSRSLKVESF